MSDSTPNAAPDLPVTPRVILLPAERFFVRRIPLVSDSAIESQVELALEARSPFALEQLFYGYVVDSAHRYALIFAAYRRGFSAQEQAAWNDSVHAVPAFLLWTVAGRAKAGVSALVREQGQTLEAVAWDDASELPSHLLIRSGDGGSRKKDLELLLAELSRRTGVTADDVRRIDAEILSAPRDDEVQFSCTSAFTGTLTHARLITADVRDKAVLTAHRRDRRRATLVGGVFSAIVAGLAACLVLELTVLGGRALLARKNGEIAALAPEIQKIESAQYLASKLEKMAAQQLQPFEMLALINQPRPASIEFLRVTTAGPLRLDIEAQTANAGDLRIYESALRGLAGIERVELRDPRMRSGRTTFALEVNFQPNWATQGEGP